MAGAAVDNASSVCGAPSPGPRPSYLKSYPYLFVRETDQTDYFCTVCEECLTEDQLQSHLFETHSAENLQAGKVGEVPHLDSLFFTGLFCSCQSKEQWRKTVSLHLCRLLGQAGQ